MRLWDWISILARGGTGSLNSAESALLTVVANTLPADEARILREQVAEIDLVQRPQRGRMAICFYSKNACAPKFDVHDEDACIARVTWKLLGGKKVKVKLMIYKGRFKNLEGHIPATPISSTDCVIELWPSLTSTLPGAIDRLEHGE